MGFLFKGEDSVIGPAVRVRDIERSLTLGFLLCEKCMHKWNEGVTCAVIFLEIPNKLEWCALSSTFANRHGFEKSSRNLLRSLSL